jgi:adenine phosphoribosyltransferase
LDILDIVISEDTIHHDMDATGLGFKRGQIPFTDLRFFESCPDLKEIAISSLKKLNLSGKTGRILTGDQFINDSKKSFQLREEFSGDCIDMESAAVAQVCYLNKIPFLIIRSLSDKADGSAQINFNEFVKSASKNSFILVKEILNSIEILTNQDDLEIIKSSIRTIPNFPKEGIMFRDVTTLLGNYEVYNKVINLFEQRYKNKKIDVVAGVESRGFIVGSNIADRLKVGFVPIRKKGKLPYETISEDYDLEYGKDSIEIHKDAIKPGQKVLLVDDLIATGGTAKASAKLIEKIGGEVVECAFVVELPELNGREKLSKWPVYSVVEFAGE